MTPLYGQFSDSLKTTLEISVRHRYVCRRISVGASAGIGWRVYAIHVGAESGIGLVGCLRPAGARLGQDSRETRQRVVSYAADACATIHPF